jgi:hypothetical protein
MCTGEDCCEKELCVSGYAGIGIFRLHMFARKRANMLRSR